MRGAGALLLGVTGFFPAVAAAGEIVRICANEWEPYAYAIGGEPVKGITVQLVTAAMARLGRDVHIQLAPHQRCIQALLRGSVDMVLFANADEQPQLPHSNTSTERRVLAMWVRNESALSRYTGISLFQGFSVGLVTGYAYPDPVGRFPRWQAVSNPDSLTNLRQLAYGRVGVVPEDYVLATRLVRRWQLPIRPLSPPVASIPQCALFSEQYRNMVPAYDAELKKMRKDGLFDEAYRAETGKEDAKWLQWRGPSIR